MATSQLLRGRAGVALRQQRRLEPGAALPLPKTKSHEQGAPRSSRGCSSTCPARRTPRQGDAALVAPACPTEPSHRPIHTSSALSLPALSLPYLKWVMAAPAPCTSPLTGITLPLPHLLVAVPSPPGVTSRGCHHARRWPGSRGVAPVTDFTVVTVQGSELPPWSSPGTGQGEYRGHEPEVPASRVMAHSFC